MKKLKTEAKNGSTFHFSFIFFFFFSFVFFCLAWAQSDRASIQARKQMDDGRLVNNKRQPEGLPRFTAVGFKKTRVPDDVWDLVKTYYEENK